MPVKIDHERCCLNECECGACPGCSEECRSCVQACPVEAITKGRQIDIDQDKCIDCGVCITLCPKKALSME